jgi:hypothetical protein
VVTRARKSISNFGLREGMPIGAMVTLRGARMYEFLDRLINVAIPRIRDFRGVPTRSFDGRGNYTLGVKEQLIFPEIDYDKVMQIHGMDIVIVTTTNKDDEALALLRELGMPFRGETPVLVVGAAGAGDGGRRMARKALIEKSKREAEVRRAREQPLQAVRPAARVPAEVRALPDLLPEMALNGEIPGVRKASW